MTPHALALLLILLPPADDLPETADPVAWQALKDTADLLELWPRAGPWATSYASELRWCQTYQRCAYGSPPLSDAHRWPSWETADAMVRANEAHLAWLADQPLTRGNVEGWERQAELARWCGLCWQAARDAQNPGQHLAGRRWALKRLRELLGESDFYAGQMPPPFPVRGR